MRRCLTLLAVLSSALPASAQPLHGHPQKIAYTSPAEWPTDSGQCHWTPAGLDVTDAMVGHTHVDMTFPRYAELNAPITIPFAVKLFHVAGHIDEVDLSYDRAGGRAVLTWDATGTETPPPLVGDPTGLRMWTGHAVLSPDPAWPHGWFTVTFQAVTRFDNGDATRVFLLEPGYSTADLSKPEQVERMTVGAFCNAGSPRRPEVQNGTIQSYVQDQYLPLGAYSAWPTTLMQSQGYGTVAPNANPANLQERVDLDLHNGIPGRILVDVSGRDDLGSPVSAPMALDGAILGPGPHKVALIRTQPDGGVEAVSALLVFDVTVDPTVPPPPPPPVVTCDVGFHLNNGICVADPPPLSVPDVWHTVATLGGVLDVQQFGALQVWRVCAGTMCTTEFPVAR